MTVILQAGDRIHLAAPMGDAFSGEAAVREAKRINDDLTAVYAALGVFVVCTSVSSTLTHPVVVSVVRGPVGGAGQS